MMTKDQFVARFGPIRPLEAPNRRWGECRVPCRDYPDCGPMFAGQFWASGYVLPGDDPEDPGRPWAEIAQDVELSRAWADYLQGYVLSSDTDCAYFPCWFVLPEGADFAPALKAALGWQVAAAFETSEFWGDVLVRALRPGSSAFFWDPMDDDVVDAYFGAGELAALRRVTAEMRATLSDLRYVAFPEGYVTYPAFWLGRTPHNTWVGLWSLRVDT